MRARLIRALDTLRKNKTAEARVAKLRKALLMLKGQLNGRSNNSFNASGNSLISIRETWMLDLLSPAALIRAFGG